MDKKNVEDLIKDLKDEDVLVRWTAAEALGETKDTRAVEPLINALKDEDEYVRCSATMALRETKDTRAAGDLSLAHNLKE
ncbi:MAG: HEAT repeat domain-containing protein [Planctomycetota bacterium]|jgi:HEAT repeat protein